MLSFSHRRPCQERPYRQSRHSLCPYAVHVPASYRRQFDIPSTLFQIVFSTLSTVCNRHNRNHRRHKNGNPTPRNTSAPPTITKLDIRHWARGISVAYPGNMEMREYFSTSNRVLMCPGDPTRNPSREVELVAIISMHLHGAMPMLEQGKRRGINLASSTCSA